MVSPQPPKRGWGRYRGAGDGEGFSQCGGSSVRRGELGGEVGVHGIGGEG